MIGYGIGKIILKFLLFCQLYEEYQVWGKYKVMLYFSATEMCFFEFSFEFAALELPCSKIQKGNNFNIIFPIPTPIIYNSGLAIVLDKHA